MVEVKGKALIIRAIFIARYLFFFRLVLGTAHPISIGLVLVGMALVGGALLIKVSISWFIYLSTLASNEKLYMPTSFSDLTVSALLLVAGPGLLKFKVLRNASAVRVVVRRSLYEARVVGRLFFLITYLLLTLVSVVKLVKFESGPLVARL